MPTFREIKDAIAAMPEERQEDDAAVLLQVTDEVIPVQDFVTKWAKWEASDSYKNAQVDGVLGFWTLTMLIL
tara:strand:- start:203 stop:418 length:216 start_codon:yes stop_codon:yes gene_type:complete